MVSFSVTDSDQSETPSGLSQHAERDATWTELKWNDWNFKYIYIGKLWKLQNFGKTLYWLRLLGISLRVDSVDLESH